MLIIDTGAETLRPESVEWAGDAAAAVGEIKRCYEEWSGMMAELREADLDSPERTRWPYRDRRPFSLVIGWANAYRATTLSIAAQGSCPGRARSAGHARR